uniref:putative ADP-ribosylation factor-like protein 5C n=1 Tax=Macaca mulatta TaxID=9544 RepID=UPI0010A21072|nr:putative ADP-ribosylation factor-like protein 5C [Macaca mulatta]
MILRFWPSDAHCLGSPGSALALSPFTYLSLHKYSQRQWEAGVACAIGQLIAKLMSIFGNQEQKVIIMGLDNAGEHHSLPVVSDFRAVRVEGWASHQTDRHGDQSLELFPGLQGSSVPGGVIENAAWTFLVLRLLGLAFKSCTVRATLAPTAFLHLPGAPAKPSSRPAKCPNLPSWSSLPLAAGRPFLTPVPSVS